MTKREVKKRIKVLKEAIKRYEVMAHACSKFGEFGCFEEYNNKIASMIEEIIGLEKELKDKKGWF